MPAVSFFLPYVKNTNVQIRSSMVSNGWLEVFLPTAEVTSKAFDQKTPQLSVPCTYETNFAPSGSLPHWPRGGLLYIPSLDRLRTRGSKLVINNFWVWGISFIQGPSVNMISSASCPWLLFVTWGGHISWLTFPLKFRVSWGEQQKATLSKG